MSRFLRRVFSGLVVLAILLAALGAGGWLWLRTSLPRLDGEIAVTGLAAPVTVARDAGGVPFIRAENDADGSFALGFVHAQDRFAQMEMTRRIGAGRMAEVLGSDMLALDRTMRTYGIYRLAAADAADLPAEVRASLDAYAAGVNAWLEEHEGALPPEFYALWIDPEPWTVTDSIVWIRLMALRLTDNWNTELLRATLRRHLTEPQLRALFPDPEPTGPTTLAITPTEPPRIAAGNRDCEGTADPVAWPGKPRPSRRAFGAPQDEVLLLERCSRPHAEEARRAVSKHEAGPTLLSQPLPPPSAPATGTWRDLGPNWAASGGSNAWILSGDRTETGRPILANDPHLGMGAPGVWYLARIDTPNGTLAGATAPGLPFLILGHNGKVAWGLTTTHGDASDLFVERLDTEDAALYETPDGRRRFEIRNEVIRVRMADDVLHVIRSSRHGPVVSDVMPLAAAAAGDGHVLALSHAALLPGDPGAAALHGVNRAADVAGLREALRAMRAPQQNVAYADTKGGIALSMPARVPVRRSGEGIDINPGWTGMQDWTGFVPFEELPHVRDPVSGLIVNANNRLVPPDYPHFISRLWPEGYRARRIETVIRQSPPADMDAMAALQLDIRSGAAEDLLPDMIDAAAQAGADPAMLDGLRAWDREMAAERWEPLVYQAWVRQAMRTIFADELGPTFDAWWSDRPAVLRHALRADGSWCDDVATAAVETCGARLVDALGTALDELAARHGPDRTAWRWGDAHAAIFRHILFGRIPGLRQLTDIRTPAPGGQHTVNRGGFRLGDPDEPFAMVFGAGYRAVYDLDDLDGSRFIVAPGQSGNPLSPHYADMVDDWREGRYVTLTPPESPAHLLRLVPVGADR